MVKKVMLLSIFLLIFVLSGVRADCGCSCCHDAPCCGQQIGEADSETVRALLEDDPFGEETDDATIVPPAPTEIIEVPQPTSSQALLQRLGCALLSGYLLCVDCVDSLWKRLKSLY